MYGRRHVYTDEVVVPLIAASRAATSTFPKLKLLPDYFGRRGSGEAAGEAGGVSNRFGEA